MNNFVRNKALRLGVALAMWINLTAAVFGQTVSQPPINQKPKPLMQPITVQTRSVAKPQPSSTPLVTKTGSSVPVARKTSFPVLADVEIPGFSGILVEDLSGNVVMDSFFKLCF